MSPERERKSPRAVSMCELMFYNNNLKGKGERRQVMTRCTFILLPDKQGRVLTPSPVFYGLKLIASDTHVPLTPLFEHTVIVARSLCPVGS